MKLTLIDDNNQDKRLDEVCPKHFAALAKVDPLGEVTIPTLREKKAEIKHEKVSTIKNKLKQ